MMFSFFIASICCSLLSLVSALPVVSRDVWVPKIISPDSSTTWIVNGTYAVTWDTSSKPSEVTNPLGRVYLRHDGSTESTPLAQGFSLTDGKVNVTIPKDTQPHKDWILVLMGDSGNWSPPFHILASSPSSSPSS